MADIRRKFSVFSWVKRLWFVASLALGLPFLIVAALFVWEKLAWATDRDNRLFEATCDHCHAPLRAHRYAESPDEWRRTVERMLAKDREYGKLIDLDRRERVIGVLVRNRSAGPRALFFFRCGRCHSRSAVEPYLALDEKTLSVLLRQHNKQNNDVIQTWEGELIEQAVLDKRANRPPAKMLSSRNEQLLFQRDCGICHTARFLYRRECETLRDEAQWTAIATRMREKAPDFIGKDEIAGLASHSKLICDTKKIAP